MSKQKNGGAHRDWKGDLQRLIDRHNGRHAVRSKTVSHSTQAARASGLFRIFKLLRSAGFKIGPSSLGGRHIDFLMGYWTADRTIEAALRLRGSTLPLLETPLSAAYIQQQLSFLRALSDWIEKPGLVRPAQSYGCDPALVTRASNATRDRTWSAANVDVGQVVAEVGQIDAVVRLQLELILAFGLRRKEAVMFCPTLAEVPVFALPAGAGSERYLAFVRVKRGTKGGRVRYTAIRNDYQRDVLRRALAAAPHRGSHVGRPGLSLKQSLDRFSNVLHRCGVTQRALGVTAHGLRHEFASDLYYELTHVPPPIKGGMPSTDPAVMEHAYLEVAQQLGHGRARITGAYLGSRSDGRRPAQWTPEMPSPSTSSCIPVGACADERADAVAPSVMGDGPSARLEGPS